MEAHVLYRGAWPQSVSKLAKYSVRLVDGEWKVTVSYDAGVGLRYLAVEGGATGVAKRVNAVKTALRDKPGGAFYVNEYRHLLVPVGGGELGGAGSLYYCAGRLIDEFRFEYESQPLTTRPVRPDGTPLEAGERWIGPRPGIPYVLAAGAGDIYYKTPALTEADPPTVRAGMTRKVQLTKVLHNRQALPSVIQLVARVRGHKGGRFYVNEHGAMFTPLGAGDGDGLDYIYCGQISPEAWFPEPQIELVAGGGTN
ncbi:MAG TPA: hypothetical protein PLE61_10595 [Vicinamibacterales bacterium]|nr:hypothetical protein [Vicinamibacterales bacterium]